MRYNKYHRKGDSMKVNLIKYVMIVLCLSGCSKEFKLSKNGVTQDEIIIGQSCAMTGPASDLGEAMNAGLKACIDEINKKGGIEGRKIRLLTLDDAYNPYNAIRNVESFLEEKHGLFLLIGEVGTPTSRAILPIIEREKIPFLGPFTGAECLRNPYNKYIINIRASYFQEMEKIAEYIERKGLTKIACFYQNDGYGMAGLRGIQKAIEKKNKLKLVAKATYERNTTAVKVGCRKIFKERPDAIVMVGAYKPCAEFIKRAKRFIKTDNNKWNPIFCNISFVGPNALRKELKDEGEGCIISQVVNHLDKENNSLVADYEDAMNKASMGSKIGFVSFEGYIAGKFFCSVLKKLKRNEVTREIFINKIFNSNNPFTIGNYSLKYGDNDNQGLDINDVFLTEIRNGQIKKL